MTQGVNQNYLTLPIPERYRQWAREFSAIQLTPEKATQVYLNTLAVLVVDDCLQMLGIATDRKASDSWNPVIQLVANMGDLELPNLGKLECRAIRESAVFCEIPLEVLIDRIGYVVVELETGDRQAKILGFVPKVTTEILPIRELQPLEACLDYLDHLRHKRQVEPTIQLQTWLTGAIATGWQTLEELLPPDLGLRLSFRSTQSLLGIRRAKSIDFENLSLVLAVEIQPIAEGEILISLQLYPGRDQNVLPPGLELMILDETYDPVLVATSQTNDQGLQLKFIGESEEIIQVQMNWQEYAWIAFFQI